LKFKTGIASTIDVVLCVYGYQCCFYIVTSLKLGKCEVTQLCKFHEVPVMPLWKKITAVPHIFGWSVSIRYCNPRIQA